MSNPATLSTAVIAADAIAKFDRAEPRAPGRAARCRGATSSSTAR